VVQCQNGSFFFFTTRKHRKGDVFGLPICLNVASGALSNCAISSNGYDHPAAFFWKKKRKKKKKKKKVKEMKNGGFTDPDQSAASPAQPHGHSSRSSASSISRGTGPPPWGPAITLGRVLLLSLSWYFGKKNHQTLFQAARVLPF